MHNHQGEKANATKAIGTLGCGMQGTGPLIQERRITLRLSQKGPFFSLDVFLHPTFCSVSLRSRKQGERSFHLLLACNVVDGTPDMSVVTVVG